MGIRERGMIVATAGPAVHSSRSADWSIVPSIPDETPEKIAGRSSA